MAKRGNGLSQDSMLDMCLDLGGDSLKIAYAFTDADGSTAYGKVDTEGDIADVGVPAVAFYDDADNEWLYGDEIDAAGKTSFVNVVRIKDLLSLLDDNGAASNKKYYKSMSFFPKFYFPARRGGNSDFGATVEADRAFVAEGFTPQIVCENYFEHIKSLIMRRLPDICSERIGITDYEEFTKVRPRISIVYSPNACDAYIAELQRIVAKVFGHKPHKSMTTTKALSMYAYTNKLIGSGGEMLVFDMGEESMSVAKAAVVGSSVTIEGEEGHNLPVALGGTDVDEALVKYIESTIERRETPGTPSYGNEGHLFEEGLQSKQYLLMKDLKQAKVLLSREIVGDDVFGSGVPISVWRELCIRRVITREELLACLGIANHSGVAKIITDYILSEMQQPLSRDVKKIFLSGGIANTYGLRELIATTLKDNGFRNIEFITIPGADDSDTDLKIYKYEATAYAAAVGGAMVALNNVDVKATLSLSYGTFVYLNCRPPKVLKLFVSRGTPLKDGRNDFWSDGDGRAARLNTDDQAISDTFYSTIITQDDINAQRYKYKDINDDDGILYKDRYPVIDEPGTSSRTRAEKTIFLKEVVSGNIVLMYKGEHVTMDSIKLLYREGITVDSRGRAEPIIENVTPGDISGTMRFYHPGSSSPYKSEYKSLAAKDIDLVFSGFENFKVNKG